jgi:hypothetical protein
MIIEHYMLCYHCKYMKYFDRHSDLIMCRKFGILHGTRYSCNCFKDPKPNKTNFKKVKEYES